MATIKSLSQKAFAVVLSISLVLGMSVDYAQAESTSQASTSESQAAPQAAQSEPQAASDESLPAPSEPQAEPSESQEPTPALGLTTTGNSNSDENLASPSLIGEGTYLLQATNDGIQTLDVDAAITCKLSPKKAAYNSGESMQFNLIAQYATPGGGSSPQTVKLGIRLPNTTPAAKLPMFNRTGSGDYAGVPMYSLNYNGNTVNLYLVTLDDGSRRIEFTLGAGETIQGIIALSMPNGATEPMAGEDAFTLTPVVLSTGDYGKSDLEAGSVEVVAQFGWEDVKLEASTRNIGTISGTERNPESVVLTMTADGKASGSASGAIFSKRYQLSTDIALNSMHINDGVLTSSETGGTSSFFIDGAKVLDVAAPLAELTVTKQLTDGVITGFTVAYTKENTTLNSADAQALSNLSIPLTFYTAPLALDSTHTETAIVVNTSFDAQSAFYDEATGKTGDEYKSHSEASTTIYAADNYRITKNVFKDAACTEAFDTANDFMEDTSTYYYKIVGYNDSGTDRSFTITDKLPDGLVFKSWVSGGAGTRSGQELSWKNITIPGGKSAEHVIAVTFDITKITSSDPLKNTALLSNEKLGTLASDTVQTTFRAGNSTDSTVSYSKSTKEGSGGLNDPLTYTIDVKNENKNAAKFIDVQDNWPGDKVRPVSATVGSNGSCTEIVLVDTEGVEHHFGDDLTGVTIKKIQFKGLYIPKGGTVKLTINSTIIDEFNQLDNSVQTGTGDGEVVYGTPAYGVKVAKTAHSYTEKDGVGAALTIQNLMKENDIVCYQIDVTNLKKSTLESVTMTDKLPSSLGLASGTLGGVTGTVIMLQDGEYTDVTREYVGGDYTSPAFALEGRATATFYLFTKVTSDTMTAAKATENRITNDSYASFNGIRTGDASANFYVYDDMAKAVDLRKVVDKIGNYDDDLNFVDSGLKDWSENGTGINNTTSIEPGNIVIYHVIAARNKAKNGYTLPLYEVIDTLPEGMEFVGLLKSGALGYGASANTDSLSGKMILAGETGAWGNGRTDYPYSADITVDYNEETRQVRLIPNGGDPTNPITLFNTYENSNQQAHFYIVARATDKEPTYTNLVEGKFDADVSYKDYSTRLDPDDENYRYLGRTVSTGSVNMTPGITKSLVGHYFQPIGNAEPDVQATTNIDPAESLRYQIQLKNQDNSTNYKNNGATAAAPTYSYLSNYTVTDILPEGYVYKANSSSLATNHTYSTQTQAETTISTGKLHEEHEYTGSDIEPVVEPQDDGTTKLTWTFSADRYRILSCYKDTQYEQYKDTGFMNILTYDVDRDPAFASTYGSYTNSATVTHDASKFNLVNVSTGQPDYTLNAIKATSIVNVFGASGTVSSKSVRNDLGESVNSTSQNNTVTTTASGILHYSMLVRNATEKSTVSNLVFIDELPRESGDTGVVNRVDRESDFNVVFNDAPHVAVQLVDSVAGTTTDIDAGNYTIQYGTSTGEGLRAKGDWSTEGIGFISWGNSSAGTNAVRVIFKSDFTVQSNQEVKISFDAQCANALENGEPLTPTSTAWNSFGYCYSAYNPDDESTSPIIYSEPQKVGATIPGAQISITKNTVGDVAPTDKPFSFCLTTKAAGATEATPQVHTAYRINGEDEYRYTDASGNFTLYAGQTATIFTSPINGTGALTEIVANMPNHFTFASVSGDGTVDPDNTNSIIISGLEDNAHKTINFTNRYTAPEQTTLALTVVKQLAGAELPEDKQFTFNLERTDGGSASDVTMPSAEACTATTEMMRQGSSQPVSFGDITFNAAGTYTFEISEVASGMANMKDADPQNITVTVTDNGGALTAAVENGETTRTFVNTYTPPTDPETPTGGTPGDTDGGDTGGTDGTGNTGGGNQATLGVKTGDTTPIVGVAAFATSAFLLVLYTRRRMRKHSQRQG